MFKRFVCRLRGHKINLLDSPHGNVSAIAYFCPCGKRSMSRELREQTINDQLDRMSVA